MRLIDADALREMVPATSGDMFGNCRNCSLLYKEQVMELIDMTPTVDMWIPCSERLPWEHDPYEVLCCDVRGEQIIAHIYESDESNTGYSAESDDTFMVDCIAWMPLPEPYKKDMRGDDHEISYGGFITTDDMLDFGYESVGDLAVAFAEFLKNNMRGDDHA
jgi:hypothetical protein